MAKSKRSPAHPTLNLEAAIDRAKQILDGEGRHMMPLESVADAWGLSPKSSGFSQYVGTLIQFGLLVDEGSRNNRQVQLTELALDILLHDEESDERREAIRGAAMNPPLHQELWERYEGSLPNSDSSIRAYLVRQRQGPTFNHAHVDGFIRQFRETIEYSGWTEHGAEDNIDQGEESKTSKKTESLLNNSFDEEFFRSSFRPQQKSKMVAATESSQPESKQEVFTLDEGPVLLRWPSKMSAESYHDFEDHLQLILRKVKRSVGELDEE